jgi:3-hydroxyisobutyrate dehydrogenase
VSVALFAAAHGYRSAREPERTGVAVQASRRVAVIGVGNMGAAMARRLLAQGFDVAIRDIRPEAERSLAALGARKAVSPAEAALDRDVVLVVVVDAPQVDAVLFDEPGAAVRVLRPGQTLLLHSTIAPDDVARIARRCMEAGALVVDAPISGGPARAEAGRLSVMAAAGDAAMAAAEPVLSALSDRVFRVGPHPGQGATMKLVNNLLAGIHLVAGAQAFALGQSAGLDPRTMFDVVCASSGQSWIVADRFARLLAGDTITHAQTGILAKDIRLALDLARSLGAAVPLGEQAGAAFAAALQAGLADEDDATLARLYWSP